MASRVDPASNRAESAQEPVKSRGGPIGPLKENGGPAGPLRAENEDPVWWDVANVTYARWLADEHANYLRTRA